MTINKGVEFLIDRMRAHPEEFRCYVDSAGDLDIGGRWEEIYDKYKNTLSSDDIKALIAAVSEINADKFLGELMAELADGPERRAKEKAEREARERTLAKATQKTKTLHGALKQSSLAGAYDQQKLLDAYQKAALDANVLSEHLKLHEQANARQNSVANQLSPYILKDRY